MKVLAVLMAFFSINVMAMSDAEVNLDSNGIMASPPTVETRFAADKELGRAWIVLTVKENPTLDSIAQAESVKVRVDGLSYDPVSGNITYEGPNKQKTVCAEQRRFFAARFFKKTRDCKINVAFDTRKVDDGFNLREERVANIVLDVAKR